MIEISSLRKYNSKTFLNDDGSHTYKSYVGDIHYKDENGALQDVDFTLVDQGTYWEMTKASYHLFVYKDFGANQLIRYENHYEGANHFLTYDPKVLAWVNATDFSDYQVFRQAQSVTGSVTGNVIRYENAFGTGIHFEITLIGDGFKKEIVIDAKNNLELPPTTNHKLVALFRYTHSGLTVKGNDTSDWDNEAYLESENGYSLRESNPLLKSFIRPAAIYDANLTSQRIKVFWKKHNNALWQAKILPKVFLNNATYPVRADTTTTYGDSSGSGRVENNNQTSWANARGATTGTAAGTDYGFTKSRQDSSADFDVLRSFFSFDTSGLPDDATITAATLHIHIGGAYADADNDGEDYVVVTQSTQASDTGLTTADFDAVGFTAGSDAIDLGTLSANGTVDFTLNETGRGWISKTGYSKFAVIEGHDHLNHVVAESADGNGISLLNLGTAVADKYPELSITYTEATTTSSSTTTTTTSTSSSTTTTSTSSSTSTTTTSTSSSTSSSTTTTSTSSSSSSSTTSSTSTSTTISLTTSTTTTTTLLPLEFNSYYQAGNDDTKAYYRFSEGALTTDSSGNNHALTPINTPVQGLPSFGGAVGLNGAQAYSVADHDDFKPSGNFSVSVWAKTTKAVTRMGLFQSYSQNTAIAGILLTTESDGKVYLFSGKNTGTVNNTDYALVASTNAISDGNWHHIVATYDGSKLHMYIDGSENGTGTVWANAAVFAATNYVRVGVRNSTGTNANYWAGVLDDLAFFNGTALDSTQVTALYADELNDQASILSSATAYYRFEDGFLTTDTTGNAHTLTAIGTPLPLTTLFNGHVFLNNSGSYSITDHNDFKPTSSFTVGAWVKTLGVSTYIFQSWSVNTNYAGFAVSIGATGTVSLVSGKNTGTTANVDYKQITSTATVNNGNWHYVVATYDNTTLKLYIDGVLDASDTWAYGPAYAATNYVRIGCRNLAGTDALFLTGAIDDLYLVTNKAMGADEIAYLFNQQNTPTTTSTSSSTSTTTTSTSTSSSSSSSTTTSTSTTTTSTSSSTSTSTTTTSTSSSTSTSTTTSTSSSTTTTIPLSFIVENVE